MKNQHLDHNHYQNEQFKRKLNHHQAVIGMPNWGMASPTPEEVRYHIERGQRLHSKAVVGALSKMFQAITSGLQFIIIKPAQHYLLRQAERKQVSELLQFDDHMLKDIGISREEVYAMAKNKGAAAELIKQRRLLRKPQHVSKTIDIVQQAPIKLAKAHKRFAANDARHVGQCA